MSEDSKMYRQQMRDKAERLVRTDPKERVDASGYTPPDALDADVQTGPRPISRRQFKSGGVVVDGKAVRRGDRKPRASGGNAQTTPNSFINRNVREANENRDGYEHVGGFKRGGHVHEDEAQDKKLIRSEIKKHEAHCKCAECYGGRIARKEGGGNWIKDAIKHPGSLHKALHVKQDEKIPEKKLEKAEHSKNPHLAKKAQLAETLKGLHKAHGGSAPKSHSLDGSLQGTRPEGGRIARKHGGKTKGKTNINIIIGQKEPATPMMPMPMSGPMAGPTGMRQGVPPPMPPQMPAQGATMPPQGPMMRKSGGRT